MDKRFLRTCLVIFLAIILYNVFLSIPVNYCEKYDVKGSIPVAVHAGDTIWGLCREQCPEDIDIREYIEMVKQLSGKWDDEIHVGEILMFPIIEEEN